MPTNVIDALLPQAPPSRAADAPPRGGERDEFAPALKHAMQTEGAAAPEERDAHYDDAEASESEPHQADDSGHSDAVAETTESHSDSSEHETATSDDQDNDDDLDAAEEAAAAAAAAAAKKTGTQQPAEEGREATAVAVIDATKSAVEATKPDGSRGNVDKKDVKKTVREFGDVLAAKATAAGDAPAAEKHVVEKRKPAASDAKPRNVKTAAAANRAPTAHGTADQNPRDEATTQSARDAAADAKAAVKPADDDDSSRAERGARSSGRNATTHDASDASANVAADAPPTPNAPKVEAHRASEAVPTNDKPPAPVNAAAAPEPATASRATTALARLTAERSIHTAAAANNEDHGSTVDRARFVGRVEGAIRTANQRDGRVHVRLSPPELGALRIELTVHQGALSAHLEAETPAARNLLLDNLPALRERLAQQDVRVERFDVDLRQETSGGGSGHPGTHDRQARDSHPRQPQARVDRGVQAGNPPARGALRPGGARAADAALDVRV